MISSEMILNSVTAIGVLISLVSIILLYRQLKEMQKTGSGDFLLRLQDEFFWKQNNAEIIKCIESNKKILKQNKGKFSDSDMDNYLGAIELIYLYLQQKIIKGSILNYFFGHYIIKTHENKEIKEYIKKARKLTKKEVYSGLNIMAKKFIKENTLSNKKSKKFKLLK